MEINVWLLRGGRGYDLVLGHISPISQVIIAQSLRKETNTIGKCNAQKRWVALRLSRTLFDVYQNWACI